MPLVSYTLEFQAWTLINTLLGKNSKPNNLSEVSVSDNLVSMAEALNDNFVNIGSTLAAEYEEEYCPNNQRQYQFIPMRAV